MRGATLARLRQRALAVCARSAARRSFERTRCWARWRGSADAKRHVAQRVGLPRHRRVPQPGAHEDRLRVREIVARELPFLHSPARRARRRARAPRGAGGSCASVVRALGEVAHELVARGAAARRAARPPSRGRRRPRRRARRRGTSRGRRRRRRADSTRRRGSRPECARQADGAERRVRGEARCRRGSSRPSATAVATASSSNRASAAGRLELAARRVGRRGRRAAGRRGARSACCRRAAREARAPPSRARRSCCARGSGRAWRRPRRRRGTG